VGFPAGGACASARRPKSVGRWNTIGVPGVACRALIRVPMSGQAAAVAPA
jgi:hypothetical protein